jgi:hypothetical protein
LRVFSSRAFSSVGRRTLKCAVLAGGWDLLLITTP